MSLKFFQLIFRNVLSIKSTQKKKNKQKTNLQGRKQHGSVSESGVFSTPALILQLDSLKLLITITGGEVTCQVWQTYECLQNTRAMC